MVSNETSKATLPVITEWTASIIESALRGGGQLHAFLSGGGLRVVRVEKPRHGKLIGYGEHPVVSDALRILADDLAAGGRRYSDVYGKTEDEYLTGQSSPEDALDAWLRQGSTFDASFDDAFVFELRGLETVRTSEAIVKRALAGETVQWEERGFVYESTPSRFPSGEPCVSSRVVSSPAGRRDSWMWDGCRTGRGPTLIEAMDAAFGSEKVEVRR